MDKLEEETKKYAHHISVIIAEIEREVSEYYQFLPPYLKSELIKKLNSAKKINPCCDYFFIFFDCDYEYKAELVINLDYVVGNTYKLEGHLPRNEREIENFLYRSVGSWCGHAAWTIGGLPKCIQKDVREILTEIEKPEIITLRKEVKKRDEKMADQGIRINALDKILVEVILELERTKSRFKSKKIAEIRKRLEDARKNILLDN